MALLTTGIWPFVIGGVQKHSYYLFRYLARAGIQVDLYHTTFNGTIPNLPEQFSKTELQYINDIYVPFPSFDKLPGKYLRASYQYSERLFEEVLKREMPDIVYSKGLSAWKMLKEKSHPGMPPVCVNVHGYEYFQKAASLKTKMEQLMLRPAFRFVNEHADYIYSYGAPISNIIRKNIRHTEGKIIEIPAGIEREQLGEYPLYVNSVREFVFIGRYERRKGMEELLKVAERLSASHKFKIHFIGPVPENKRIKSSNFIFYGEVKDKSLINSVLQKADLLVCPSYSEGMPNVILEGMAAGCAVVASAVGAIPVMVSSANGWLIEPGSETSLEHAMREAIDVEETLLVKKKQESHIMVTRQFMWDDIATQTINSFNFILEQRRKKSA